MQLNPDKGIASLAKRVRKDRLRIREDDIKNVLKPYNLQDALITLGWWSVHTRFYDDDRLEGKTMWREPKASVPITQHALAYLANLCLISKAGDYKDPRLFPNDDNVPMLCAIYNQLPDPLELEDESLSGEERFQAWVLRSHYEQMALQFRANYLIGRNVLMFLDDNCKEVSDLNRVFEKANGFSMREYLQIAFVVYASLRESPTFTTTKFTSANIPQLKVDLSETAINRFLNVLTTDYEGFRKRDEEMNLGADPLFTRNRYNPLYEYPLIDADIKDVGRGYIVPNSVVYLFKATGGLFWWFHRYYEKQGMNVRNEFRKPFGKVFENYVGVTLKHIFGESNVCGEINYGADNRFTDWCVEVDGKVYLFEAKAYQFALASKRTGYKDAFLESESKKVLGAIEQVYRRIEDVDKFEELAQFREKEVIPIVVFLDVPYPSGRFFHEWVKEAQVGLADSKGLPGLRDFNCRLMNISELELCDGIAGKVNIEGILDKVPTDIQLGVEGLLEEEIGRPLENLLLEKTCDEFLDSILETN